MQGWTARELRRKVLIHARMRAGGAQVDVCIRDVSSRGLLAQAAAPPPRGTYIEISRPLLTIVGRVVWSKDRRFGVRTSERIDVDALAKEPTGLSQPPANPSSPRQTPEPQRLTSTDVRQRLARSRVVGNALQLGFIIAVSSVAATAALSAVYEEFSRTLHIVETALRGAR